MLIQKLKAGFIGNYHFHSKDKKDTYYVLQFLCHNSSEEEKFKGINKAIIVPVFTDVKTYQEMIQKKIGETVELSVSCSLDTGKIYYKVG